MLRKYLLVWLVLLSLAAFYWPELTTLAARFGLSITVDPFVESASVLQLLIAVTMLAIGWMLPSEEVRQVFRRWPTVLGGTTIQYVTMPALAYLFGRAFGLSGDLLVGVVMVGCVPGAMASNVLTLLAGGNASYSVSLTTSATILSPLAVPAAMYCTLIAVQPDQMHVLLQSSLTLMAIVVLPVILGHLVGRGLPHYEQQARWAGSTIANLSILWIIAVVVATKRTELAKVVSEGAPLLAALVCINLCGYAAGYFGGAAMRLPEPMRRALTLEVGMQNAGLGAALAIKLFGKESDAALAPAMYTFGCMLTGTVLARVWATMNARLKA